jgi:hypothetical protein
VDEPSSFDPRKLIESIKEAVAAGYSAVCIDSLSHYWMGPDGELDLVDATAARSTKGNSFAAWKTVTPIHNALVDLILSAKIHVLLSMRTKTEWVIEKDEKGKNVPRKIGTAPIMRNGIEYEFDVCGNMDEGNNLAITKSRCSALAGKVIHHPGRDMARVLSEWLTGAPAEEKVAAPTVASVAPAAPAKKDPEPVKTQPVTTTPVNDRVKAMRAAFKALEDFLGLGNFQKQLKAAGYERIEDIKDVDQGLQLHGLLKKFSRGVEDCRRMIGLLDKDVAGQIAYAHGLIDPAEAEDMKDLGELHAELKRAVDAKQMAGAAA